jgi:hypothetical protein
VKVLLMKASNICRAAGTLLQATTYVVDIHLSMSRLIKAGSSLFSTAHYLLRKVEEAVRIRSKGKLRGPLLL